MICPGNPYNLKNFRLKSPNTVDRSPNTVHHSTVPTPTETLLIDALTEDMVLLARAALELEKHGDTLLRNELYDRVLVVAELIKEVRK